MTMTPEQIADWFGKPATIVPGESAGIPDSVAGIAEDPQVEAQMIFDAWKAFYQQNPNAKPPAGAAPDEKRAYAAAHPLGVDLFADEKADAKAKVQEWMTANRTRDAVIANAPVIIAALAIVVAVYFLTSGKKAAAA